jgi:hypothetical protein
MAMETTRALMVVCRSFGAKCSIRVTTASAWSWLLFRQMEQNGLPLTLLVFLVWWLAITSVGFGLFAQPPNPTVVVTLALEAIAVFSAIFIILEMYRPIQRSVEHCADPNSGRAECDGMLKHADSWYWHRQMSGV